MESNYEQLKQILDNAPEGAVFWDGGSYLNLNFEYRLPIHVYCTSVQKVSYTWIRKDPINTGKLRRLSDIKEIVDLMESRDQLVQDLNDIYFSPPSGAFPRTDSDFKRVGQDLLNLINKLEK